MGHRHWGHVPQPWGLRRPKALEFSFLLSLGDSDTCEEKREMAIGEPYTAGTGPLCWRGTEGASLRVCFRPAGLEVRPFFLTLSLGFARDCPHHPKGRPRCFGDWGWDGVSGIWECPLELEIPLTSRKGVP